mmetsp:Transcript_38972/g.125205  ORF Transcript_38972/g.125205 Transcript_38972/m.125205 type:complete len:200 (-) Transcript_38972:1871-2470(-)
MPCVRLYRIPTSDSEQLCCVNVEIGVRIRLVIGGLAFVRWMKPNLGLAPPGDCQFHFLVVRKIDDFDLLHLILFLTDFECYLVFLNVTNYFYKFVVHRPSRLLIAAVSVVVSQTTLPCTVEILAVFHLMSRDHSNFECFRALLAKQQPLYDATSSRFRTCQQRWPTLALGQMVVVFEIPAVFFTKIDIECCIDLLLREL